jgi:hypothetical protein
VNKDNHPPPGASGPPLHERNEGPRAASESKVPDSPDQSNIKDITACSSQMPPDSGILYPAKPDPSWDSPEYRGIIRISEPGFYWVSAWTRTVNGRVVVELKFNRKEDTMAVFRTLPPESPPVLPGVYLAKITAAKDRVSANGNPMLVMRLSLPGKVEIPCVITFVEAARRLVNAFCDSAQLIKPDSPDVEVELCAKHCAGRWIYVVVSADPNDGESLPKVVRFLTREQAISRNPSLAEITPFQAPLVLSVAASKTT